MQGHHGYRVSALISLLPNAAWPKLAAEFLEAKKSPHTLQTFVNVVLGEAWRDAGEELDGDFLLGRVEPFNLDNIPADVLLLTCGLDVQDDRIEITTTGWTKTGDALVLGHEIVWGSPLDPDAWAEVDDLLKRTWRHPNGGLLKIDAAVVNSGSGGHTDAVYAFCRPRTVRRVFAGKGVAGFQRPLVQLSKTREVRLILVGVDAAKSQIMNRLQAGRTIRFSNSLDGNWFEQLTSEKRVVKYTRGQPIRAFEQIPAAGRKPSTVWSIASPPGNWSIWTSTAAKRNWPRRSCRNGRLPSSVARGWAADLDRSARKSERPPAGFLRHAYIRYRAGHKLKGGTWGISQTVLSGS